MLKVERLDGFSRSGCLMDTREDTLRFIKQWMASTDGKPILLLFGPAGVGKSTVASTISTEHFDSVACQFFLRGRSEISTAIRTLSYDLASHNDAFRSALLSDNVNNLIQLPSDAQFE